MTLELAATKQRRISRKKALTLAALVALMAGWLAYVANYGECDFHSKFCVLTLAGTRSEVGCEWETWNCYISTSGEDPATHTLF